MHQENLKLRFRMDWKKYATAWRSKGKILIGVVIIVIGATYFFYNLTQKTIVNLQAENFHAKMLINYEYTRRVLSDVYVSVTSNVFYLEQTLDNTEGQQEVMARIVKQGTRVHSCGMNFVRDYYYPEKGHRYCPFAWRNRENHEEILTEEKGDADFDYLEANWFTSVIDADTAMWSEPFADGYDNVTQLAAYMVPIHNQERKPVAVLGADISLDWLTNKLLETDSVYNALNPFATNVLGLRSRSFIVNHDGSFITHPEGELRLEGLIFNHLKPIGDYKMSTLIDHIEKGIMSEQESQQKFLFDGTECYLFYTPVKYTRWMMVSVVPCKSIDMPGIYYGLKILGIFIVAMLLIALLCYHYIIVYGRKYWKKE